MQMKLCSTSHIEIKQDAIKDYNVTCSGNNMALLGSTTDLVVLQLVHEPESSEIFPYGFSYIEIPQDRPCSKLIENAELHNIYNKCSVQECQELALDPMYVADYSIEPVKAKAVQLYWAPRKRSVGQPLIVVLSTYGACQVLTQTGRHWRKLIDLNKYFCDVFPVEKTIADVNLFQEFKDITDVHWITAVGWGDSIAANLIYAANAAGHLVAFEFNHAMEEIKEFCKLETGMRRITYIKAFDDFILIGNIQGAVHLFKVEHSESPYITKGESLWTKTDRMTCRQAEITRSQDLNSYFVVFTKAAHVIAYRLSDEGSLICSSSLYVGGVKITGLQTLSDNQFIITTLTGTVRCIRLCCPNNSELHIEAENVTTGIDAKNLQILGVATSQNRNLWSFLLYRNKEYTHHSKYTLNTAFINVCKLSTIDVLTVASNSNITTMDDYFDYIVSIRLDIWNSFDLEKYNKFCDLSNFKFPDVFNEAFLQNLQLKMQIVKTTMKYQKKKLKTVRKTTAGEYEFILRALQLTHIICRLQHMQLGGAKSLNQFQNMAIKCMNDKYRLIMAELIAGANDDNPLKTTTEKFAELATVVHGKCCDELPININETCLDCNEAINATTMLCPSEHKVRRCCVSYVQIPLFGQRYCAQCNSCALGDVVKLQQLFTPDESIKCPFCRFVFVNEEILC